ncbi:MAG: type II toxin-antitoxin system VapC family toxin [Beijerinckiaceae bacterium]
MATSGLIFTDSNVLIDVSQPGSAWFEWSYRAIVDAMARGSPVINAIVYAELSVKFPDATAVAGALEAYIFEDIPREAAFLAGRAHADYRKRGGTREAILPDFLIGAHCAVRSHVLLTRDARRYRHAFPDLRIIAPQD